MSIEHVRDYYMRMTSDYVELKKTLDRLEREITPETSSQALEAIERIRKEAEIVQQNYNRIKYIIYLLDKPKNKKKQARWEKQNKRKLESIPEKDRLKYIHEDNKNNIDLIRSFMP